jgi:hypothetical protein
MLMRSSKANQEFSPDFITQAYTQEGKHGLTFSVFGYLAVAFKPTVRDYVLRTALLTAQIKPCGG